MRPTSTPTVRHVLAGDFYYAPVEGDVHRTRVEEAGYVIRVGDGEAFVSDAALTKARGERGVAQSAALDSAAATLAEGFTRLDGSTYGSPPNGEMDNELEDNGR